MIRIRIALIIILLICFTPTSFSQLLDYKIKDKYRNHFESGNYSQLIELIRSENYLSDEDQYLIGECYFQNFQYDRAYQSFIKIANKSRVLPRFRAKALYRMGLCLLNWAKTEEAFEIITRLEKYESDQVANYINFLKAKIYTFSDLSLAREYFELFEGKIGVDIQEYHLEYYWYLDFLLDDFQYEKASSKLDLINSQLKVKFSSNVPLTYFFNIINSYYSYKTGNYISSLKKLKEGIDFLHENKQSDWSKILLLKYYKVQMLPQIKVFAYHDALESGISYLNLFDNERSNDKYSMAVVLSLMSQCYLKLGNYKLTSEYFGKMKGTAVGVDNPKLSFFSEYFMGILNLKYGKDREAIVHLEKSLMLSKKIGENYRIYNLVINLSIANAYFHLNDSLNARKYLSRYFLNQKKSIEGNEHLHENLALV